MSSRTSAILRARYIQLFALSLLWVIVFRVPLGALGKLTLQDGSYNYIAFVPAISLSLLFLERRRIFILPQYCPATGLPLMVAGVLVYVASKPQPMRPVSLSLSVLAMVLLWLGGFVLCYGAGTFRKAAFPLLFLLWIVPPPAFVLNKAVVALQTGSAGVSYALFRLAGVPVLREGFVFFLPGADIEVAQQCSGIRSSIALLIVGLLAGHVFLRSSSRKILLALCIVPVAIFKNAVRILTVSLLGVYIDRSFLYGSLHHQYGGLAVSSLAVGIVVPVIWILRKSEQPDSLETSR